MSEQKLDFNLIETSVNMIQKIKNDSLKESSHHFRDGGTAVTNFSPGEYPIYMEAVAEFGDHNIFIVPKAMKSTPIKDKYSMFSLHTLAPSELPSFWILFDRIKDQNNL